ncbi:MAG: endonuclease/exonuclease/phosphatase family protein [Gemmatimonadota bacterium]|nr:MAG: endonuclease/exonuclease/phosphatase family protein [Gemmatimonadota bacterium]
MRLRTTLFRRCLGPLCGVLALALWASACTEDEVTGLSGPEANLGRGNDAITVMTHNVYVGANVDIILEAGSFEEIPGLVATAFQELISTNFYARAGAIADEIARSRPHLIGLQEMSLILYQVDGDAVFGGSVPAEDTLLAFLDILMDALQARGQDYQVAGSIKNLDIEMPMIVSLEPLAFDDVRLIDYDVVLARGDVEVSNPFTKNYDDALAFPQFGIVLTRGYVAVDATIKNNHTYRFVNTHLEPADIEVQLDQADELMGYLAAERKPVIVVGDLNTPAPDGDTYQLFESEGYVDVWTRNLQRGEGEGLTNPHQSDLRNATVDFTKRIDLIFVRNNPGQKGEPVIGAVFATVWGDELSDRILSGPPYNDYIWPSDHAAVIAEMRLPVLGGPAYK